ncbi:hypothetical protein KEM54_002289 [Ascosphaera aggregata]|nr:hypothetical protein KEM54_002289 [Ascosphaera aggregata]
MSGPSAHQQRVGSFSQQQQQQQHQQQHQHNSIGNASQGAPPPAASLDLSEFPSLSGTPGQPAHAPPTPGQAIWAKAVQQPSLHQLQQQENLLRLSPQQQQQQQQQQQKQHAVSIPQQAPNRTSQPSQQQFSHDDMFPSAAQFATQLDDYRNGGQGISGQLTVSSTQHLTTGNGDDFPPLVGNALQQQISESNQEQRKATSQQQQQQHPIDGGIVTEDQNAVPTSRSPMVQAPNGIPSRSREDTSQLSLQHSQQPPLNDAQQQLQVPHQNPAQMADRDRYGLNGLLSMVHNENYEVAALAIGQDLMTLGLDLSSEQYEIPVESGRWPTSSTNNFLISHTGRPLYSTFTSPFAPSNAVVPLVPDFSLPACYNVANVQPLQNRMSGFSEETLFYIFYSLPRDIMQEFAAEELMARKWRYHKVKRLWLTRDDTYPNPVEVERGVSERGVYCWWDAATWKKVRRDFILRYADLDNHLEPGRGMLQYGQSR